MVKAHFLWILADSGSARNLISSEAFNDIAFQQPLRPVGDVKVVGKSGEFFELEGFALIPITIEQTVIWHEFWDLKRLPLAARIGGHKLAPPPVRSQQRGSREQTPQNRGSKLSNVP